MSKYYHIDNLMEYWKCDFPKAMIKIANIIKKDQDCYIKAYDPIAAVAKRIFLNKRYNYKKVESLADKTGAGNLDNDDYYYKVTFVTAAGETEECSNENGIKKTKRSKSFY